MKDLSKMSAPQLQQMLNSIFYITQSGDSDKNIVRRIAEEYAYKAPLFDNQELLSSGSLPIAVVDFQKTAHIAKQYIPGFDWVSIFEGGILSLDHIRALNSTGRRINLYPRLGSYTSWYGIAYSWKFRISDLLEKKATEQERNAKLDIADYLIRFPVSDFNVNRLTSNYKGYD